MEQREQLPVAGRFRLTFTGGLVVGAAYAGPRVLYDYATPNLIVNVGRTYFTGAGLVSVTPITSWFLGLMNGSATIAAADTMASHAGWTELVAYSQGTRPAWTVVAGGTAGSAGNSASPASFTINSAGQTAGGLFLCSNSTKSGTSGTLFAAAAVANYSPPNGSTGTAVYEVGW